MGRGGARQGTGPKPKWNNEETTVIRVPVVLKEQLLEIARRLDGGETIEGPQPPLKTYRLHNRDVVRVDKLLKLLSVGCQGQHNNTARR